MATAPKADDEILSAIGRLDARLAGEHKDNTGIMLDVKARIERMEKAFPGGDVEGHLRYHEALIKKEEKRQRFWDEMLTHVAKASAWAALAGIVVFLVRSGKDWILALVKLGA